MANNTSLLAFLLACLLPTHLSATTVTGGTTRQVNIDGTVYGQKDETNGTNGIKWEVNEEGATSSSGSKMYMSWDDTYLYVGWFGGSSTQQHIIWLDTDPKGNPTTGTGSISTFNYGNMTASLPFTANAFINIQSNYNEYRNFSSGNWSAGTSGSITTAENGNLEAKIAWSLIGGKPSSMYFLSYINDQAGCTGRGYIYNICPAQAANDGCGTSKNFTSWHNATITGGQSPFSAQGVLPIELAAFKGASTNEGVALNWTTQSEKDADHFEVQRSLDGQHWKTIGAVKAAGSSNTLRNYQFIDNQPFALNYYRLRMIDFDGSGAYSPTISVQSGKETGDDITIFPNPMSTHLNIQVPFESGEVTLRDAYGRVLRQSDGSYNQIIFWQTADLPTGYYMITRRTGEQLKTWKVSKL
jgi:hypothetical protein